METAITKNSVTTGCAAITQTSRPLAVPGGKGNLCVQRDTLTLSEEIRNRIYELAVEDNNAWPAEDFADVSDEQERACKLRELRTLATPHLQKRGTAEISWPTLKRKYLGLTQTCRQLLAETSAMHSKIWIRVNVDELGDYTREVILKDVSDNRAAAGCIEIVGLQHQDHSRINIRDFLLLYSEAPKLFLRLTPYVERSNQAQSAYVPLEPILQAKSSHSKLWDYVRDKASAVLPMNCVTKTIIFDGSTTQQYVRSNVTGLLVVGKGAVPDDWTIAQTTDDYYQAWEVWLEETGLPRNVMILPATENIQHKLFYEARTVHLISQG
jgi:hypothetical protein